MDEFSDLSNVGGDGPWLGSLPPHGGVLGSRDRAKPGDADAVRKLLHPLVSLLSLILEIDQSEHNISVT